MRWFDVMVTDLYRKGNKTRHCCEDLFLNTFYLVPYLLPYSSVRCDGWPVIIIVTIAGWKTLQTDREDARTRRFCLYESVKNARNSKCWSIPKFPVIGRHRGRFRFTVVPYVILVILTWSMPYEEPSPDWIHLHSQQLYSPRVATGNRTLHMNFHILSLQPDISFGNEFGRGSLGDVVSLCRFGVMTIFRTFPRITSTAIVNRS
jgi:hypothetical protein